MSYKEFEEFLDELNIPLKKNQKDTLYPMIATRNDIEVAFIRHKILEIQQFLNNPIF